MVQFVYGDDGLNPDRMENNDRPVDFYRLRMDIVETAPCPNEIILSPTELMEQVEQKLAEERFQKLLPTGRVFLQEIRDCFSALAKEQEELIALYGSADRVNYLGWNSCRVTETQLELMLTRALEKCTLAYVEPGEAVGAIGAQSISEPGTQMTLKVRSFCSLVHCVDCQHSHICFYC